MRGECRGGGELNVGKSKGFDGISKTATLFTTSVLADSVSTLEGVGEVPSHDSSGWGGERAVGGAFRTLKPQRPQIPLSLD